MRLMFDIKLKPAHENTGKSVYLVAKDLGISKNTVKRYVTVSSLKLDTLPIEAVKLAGYYGVDWRDPAVVEVVEVEA